MCLITATSIEGSSLILIYLSGAAVPLIGIPISLLYSLGSLSLFWIIMIYAYHFKSWFHLLWRVAGWRSMD
ncbi:MAG: hypothetical protein KKG04_06590 [Candidatus Thermoplasmatota archaeon]|nr:hypothetical protein [Candidatus Thermoplasmatota archaeon]